MALKVTLKPGEKFVINGAVIVNGDRRSTLMIQNRCSILRERDILQPNDADTPVKRIYIPIMMMYLDEPGSQEFYPEFVQRITEFINAVSDREVLARCVGIIEDVNAGHYYRALMSCKKLLPFEEQRLKYVRPNVPDRAAEH